MPEEKGLNELEHLKKHGEFLESLNADGCHFGDLLSRTVADMKKKLMSKVAGFELVAQLMLDLGKKNKTELEGIKKMAVDAIACTHAAQMAVNDMAAKAEVIRDKFDKLAWKLLWVVLGGNGLFLAAHIIISFLSKH